MAEYPVAKSPLGHLIGGFLAPWTVGPRRIRGAEGRPAAPCRSTLAQTLCGLARALYRSQGQVRRRGASAWRNAVRCGRRWRSTSAARLRRASLGRGSGSVVSRRCVETRSVRRGCSDRHRLSENRRGFPEGPGSRRMGNRPWVPCHWQQTTTGRSDRAAIRGPSVRARTERHLLSPLPIDVKIASRQEI
jgi:hypothetical protein